MLKEMVEQSLLQQTKRNLEAHRIPTTIIKDQAALYDFLRHRITSEMVVCRSGSVTSVSYTHLVDCAFFVHYLNRFSFTKRERRYIIYGKEKVCINNGDCNDINGFFRI